MRHREDFTRAVRRGRRAGRPLLVVHLLAPRDGAPDEAGSPAMSTMSTMSTMSVVPAKVGLVVSRAVGAAVIRTRVKRRLRHLAAQRLEGLSAGSLLVVRANPGAATATSAELGADLDRALDRALGRTTGRMADRSGQPSGALTAVVTGGGETP
jgi:ribonuclease P protein component